MTKAQAKKIYSDLFEKYSKEYNILYLDRSEYGDAPLAFLDSKIIIFPAEALHNPTGWYILSLLHEIGHFKTNTLEMPLYEKEYRATQWAADEAKKIKGLKFKKLWKDAYSDYVMRYYEERTEDTLTRDEVKIIW